MIGWEAQGGRESRAGNQVRGSCSSVTAHEAGLGPVPLQEVGSLASL